MVVLDLTGNQGARAREQLDITHILAKVSGVDLEMTEGNKRLLILIPGV